MKKERRLWFLTIITFVLILVFWQLFNKFFPRREKTNLKEELFSNIFSEIKEISKEMKNLELFEFLKEKKQPSLELTNEKIKKLKEKVLEYVNSSLEEKYEKRRLVRQKGLYIE